jgi:hypothetical protein
VSRVTGDLYILLLENATTQQRTPTSQCSQSVTQYSILYTIYYTILAGLLRTAANRGLGYIVHGTDYCKDTACL